LRQGQGRGKGTYVDDGGCPELGPGIVVRQMLEIVARALDERTHRTPEAFGALRVLREELVDGLVCIIRQGESLHPHISISKSTTPVLALKRVSR